MITKINNTIKQEVFNLISPQHRISIQQATTVGGAK